MINIFNVKDYRGVIYLIGRDENNERIIVENKNNFSPFHGEFYIRKDKVDILDEFEGIIEVVLTISDKKTLFGEEVMRVRYNIINFDRVSQMRELINRYRDIIYEGDLWGSTLFCLDVLPTLEYGNTGNWKTAYLDIETEVTAGVSDANNPVDRVLCFTCWDNYNKKYHYFYWGGEEIKDEGDTINHRYEKEKGMLEGIMEWMSKEEFDIVTGWNVHFDISYLLQRFLTVSDKRWMVNDLSPIKHYTYNEKYKQFTIWGLCIFDLLDNYKRVIRNQMPSFRLDDVAKEELGEQKVEVDIKRLNELSKTNLYRYNKKDVELCIKIDEKLNIIHFFDGLRQFVGCTLDDTRYSKSLIDFMLLKKSRSMNIVLPTSNSDTKSGRKKFEGAFVDAVQGSYTNVVAFDLKALYPSIIKTFNLSYETCVDEGDVNLPDTNVSMSREGIIPSMVNDLVELRQKYDEERDKYPAGHPEHEKNDILVESAKLIVDAIYGITAFPGFRLFKPEIASSITYVGREIIQHTKQFIEEKGYPVVVTDTDSSYFVTGLDTEEKSIQLGYEILNVINKEYPRWVKEMWGIEKNYLKNVFKKVYRRLIVGTKKRYCGHVVWAKGIKSDKLEVVGMETKRSDYSRFARDFQFELMGLLLNNKEDEIVEEFINDKIKQMRETLPTLIAIPTKIEKELNEYSTNLPKVRGSEYSSKIIDEEFHAGDKPLLLFTKGVSDIILFYNDKQAEKLLENVSIDWEKMTERNILMTSEMLLTSDGRDYILNNLKSRGSGLQTTLFNFQNAIQKEV